MKQMLIEQGWVKFHQCNCGGSLRQHFENAKYPGFEVRIREVQNSFTITNKGLIVANVDWGYKMEAKLKALGIW